MNQHVTINALQFEEDFNDHVISVLLYKVVHYFLQEHQSDSTSLLRN